MPKRTRYTISLLPSDLDIIEHLEKIKEQTTISMYVRNLIKNDLNEENRGITNIEQLVEKVIQRIKADDRLQVVNTSNHVELVVSDEQRDIISSLF